MESQNEKSKDEKDNHHIDSYFFLIYGALKIIFVQSKIITKCSMILSVIAVILIFLLLLIKAALLRKKIF